MLRSRTLAAAIDKSRSRCFLQVENMTCMNLISPSGLKNQLTKEVESATDRTKVRTMNVLVRFFGHALEKDKQLVTRTSKHVSVGFKQQIAPQWKDKITVLLRYNNAKRLAQEILYVQVVDRGDTGIETVLGYGAIPFTFSSDKKTSDCAANLSPSSPSSVAAAASVAASVFPPDPKSSPPSSPLPIVSKPPPIPARPVVIKGRSPTAGSSQSVHNLRGEKLMMDFQCPITYAGHFTGLLQGVMTIFSGTFFSRSGL
jgi:hypothetical protein